MKKIKLTLVALFTLVSVGLLSQNLTITGVVKDAGTGEPIPFASVVIKGSTTGVSTDLDGKYSISANESSILKFSSIGYGDVEIALNGRTTIDVTMTSTSIALDDVMVVAYTTVKKSSYTGSAGILKKDQIEKIQSTNVTKSLQGAVAGVQVLGASGQPGSSASIRIRGVGSINASSDPLYVVDGAAFDGDINSIPTDDIESISVLKDAAAAALYGARGANGVIMITTKKGNVGKATVTAKVLIGTSSRAIKEYERVDANQYYELMWEGWRNARMIAGGMTEAAANAMASGAGANGIVGRLGYYNPYNVGDAEVVGLDGKLNPNAKLLYQDNWIEALSQPGLRQDYNVAVSGGVEGTTFYSSFGYINEKGHVKWSNYDRFTGRVGVTSKINKWFKTDASISGSTSEQANFLANGRFTSNPFYYGRMMGPIYPIYQREADGSIKLMSDGTPAYDMGGGSSIYKWPGKTRPYAPNSNLILTLPLDYRGNERANLSARAGADITFLKDFNFRVSGSTDLQNIYYTTYQNNKFGDAQGVSGRSTKRYFKTRSYTFNQILTYNKAIGDHTIMAMIGHENYQYNTRDLSATRTNFKIDSNELIAGSVAEGSSSSSDIYRLEGYFGQASYSYANKYFLSGSYRYDGSSRFSPESRWGGFWSIGGSWRAKQEPFLSSVNWIDDLRLRASYGQQGNDNIGSYYGYQSLFSIDDRNNGLLNGSFYSQLANPDLKWEKNANMNIGVDFAFVERIRGQVEFFTRYSDNLLFSVPLPQSAGISSRWQNIGSMKNVGIEFQLAADIFKTKDFKWTIDLNGTHYKNTITKMPKGADGKPQEIISDTQVVSGTKKLSEGHSIYDYWLRGYAGVDATDGSALYYRDILDANGNVTEKTTTKDQNAASYYYSGSAIPDLYGGVTNTFTYKGIDLSVFFTYQIGGLMYDSNYAALMHPGTFGSHMHIDMLNRWTKTNTTTNVPRLQNAYTAATAASDRWLIDASYLSLRNITLGYNIPSRLLNKISLKSVRIFATGDNLVLFSKRIGMDPQQSFTGVADHTYIPQRIVSLGLNITF